MTNFEKVYVYVNDVEELDFEYIEHIQPFTRKRVKD